ncbi:MAG: phytoene dehydrogenase [uncultured bacterium]|nr:MAG: phytoene dehydrogenase [uncultured bacterium]
MQVLDLDPFAGNAKEPDPFCVAHLHSKLLRSILGRLNVPENDIQFLSATANPLQVVFPDKRIDVSPNPITFYEELEREFPTLKEELKNFYENLISVKHKVDTQAFYSMMFPSGFSEKRQFRKFIKTFELDKKLSSLNLPIEKHAALKAFIIAQIKLLTYAHASEPFAYQVADLINPSEGEILSIRGGHNYLKKLFLDRIQHHEGGYRQEVKIESLLFKNGIFEGVKLAGIEGNILARYIIWNAQIKPLADFLPPLWRFRGLRKTIQKLAPDLHWFTAHFNIPTNILPDPMHENLLIINDPTLELSSTNYLYLQRREISNNLTRLSVSYLLPKKYLDMAYEDFIQIHADILSILHEIIPFAKEAISLQFPLAEPEEALDTLFPLKENDFEIFRQTAREHPVYQINTSDFSDLFPLNYKTPAPNMFVTSPEILASLGYEGKYMLGLKVTDIIWKDVEKEKKHAMKTERRIA